MILPKSSAAGLGMARKAQSTTVPGDVGAHSQHATLKGALSPDAAAGWKSPVLSSDLVIMRFAVSFPGMRFTACPS